MQLEKLISKRLKIAATGIALLAAAASADLPNLASALTGKGLSITQNKVTQINGTNLTADIYLDKTDNPDINYIVVVIDEVLNTTEKNAVEAFKGKYIVASDNPAKADSIYNLATGKIAIEENENLKQEPKVNVYPNPANPSFNLDFVVEKKGTVSVNLYNSTDGRYVRNLFEGEKQEGRYSLDFKPNDLANRVFIYEVRTPTYAKSGKLILMK